MTVLAEPAAAPLAFTSRQPDVLHGALWITPETLESSVGAARALQAFADFDAYSAAVKAFLVSHIGRQIAQEPLEGRDGQPARLGGDLAHAATVSEIALLQKTSEAVAARTVNFSDALVAVHPAVHDALASGDITEAHAKVIVDQASTLPEHAAEPFGIEALGRLHTRKGHLRTPGEFRGVVRALRERLHPESIVKRHTRARAERGVWYQAEDDGMCTVTALLPAETGLAVYRRIDAIAQNAHRVDGEYRTTPQLRADAFAQLVLREDDPRPESASEPVPSAASPAPSPASTTLSFNGEVLIPEDLSSQVKAEIVVHIPAAVLLGASDDVAELEGYGVIDAVTARALAAAAPTWHRLLTDTDGVPLRLGRSVYRPPGPLRRFINYRDGVCVVPGCTRAARRAEADHTVEWQDGGTTDADNLALLCRKHHALKSLALFTLRRADDDGRGRTPPGDAPALAFDRVGTPPSPVSSGLVWETLLGFEHPAEPLDRDHILGPRTTDLAPRHDASPDPDQPPGPGQPPDPDQPPGPDQLPHPAPPPF